MLSLFRSSISYGLQNTKRKASRKKRLADFCQIDISVYGLTLLGVTIQLILFRHNDHKATILWFLSTPCLLRCTKNI